MRRGFTLAEILVCLGLIVLLISLTVMSPRAPVGSASAQGLASALTARLRLARQRAVSQHTTVAVVFPTAAGSRPNSQSFYILEGDQAPAVTQVANLAGEFREACFCCGAFACDLPQTLTPPNGGTATTAPALNIASWLAGASGYQPRDAVIAFAPDGTVVTNDLVWHGSQLEIVACTGFTVTGSVSPPGTPVAGANQAVTFGINQVYQAFTVTVSQNGQIAMVSGLAQSGSGVSQTALAVSAPPAQPPSLSGGVNQSPTLLEAQVLPRNGVDPASNVTLAGYGTLLNGNERASVIVRALDPDAGDHLSVNVTVDAGTLSCGNSVIRMVWDPTDRNVTAGYPNGCWKATFSWSPPGDPKDPAYDPPGQDFQLTGQVVDDHGGLADLGGSLHAVNFHVENRGHIVFSAAVGIGWQAIFQLAPGTNTVVPVTPVTGGQHYCYPAASPDGAQVAYIDGGQGIMVVDAELQNQPRSIFPFCPCNFPSRESTISWSPDATRICFLDTDSGDHPMGARCAMVIAPVSGNGPLGIIRDALNASGRYSTYYKTNTWSPGYLAWSSADLLAYIDGSGDVAVCRASDAQPITMADFTINTSGVPTGWPTTYTPFTPPSKVKVTTNGPSSYYYGLTWSRDNSKIIYLEADSGSVFQRPVSLAGGVITLGSPTTLTGASAAKNHPILDPSGQIALSQTNADDGIWDFYNYTGAGFTTNYRMSMGTLTQFGRPGLAGWTWTR